MKKIILHIIAVTTLLFVFSGSVFAQSSVTGIVKSGTGGSPVNGATVTILETSTSTTTNASGQYTLGVATGQIRTLVVGSISRTFLVKSGVNQMNFWINAVTDADGNNYSAVEIGTQVWMGENLKTTRYSTGSSIPLVTDGTGWFNLTTPGYCWYNNDANNKNIYGGMYNWYAVNTGNLCTSGWHVPSNAEWDILETYLGGDPIAGGMLKEAGTGHWTSPNTSADNSTGFTALPGGERVSGDWFAIRVDGSFWSATETAMSSAWDRGLSTSYSSIGMGNDYQTSGFSVRCLLGAGEPILSTTPVTSISFNSAQSGGNITNDGGSSVTARGVCWNTSFNPTIANSITTNGTGIGSFASSLTGLTPSTTYYVRAYATNSAGTNYGLNVSFTTCPNISATISGTSSVCQNAATPNITFTGSGGTAPYTFTYRINTGSAQPVTTSVGNSVTVAAPTGTAGTFTYYLLSAYDSRGSSCSQVQSGSAIVTVNQVPAITAMTATVCSGAGFNVTPVNITNGIVPAGTTYSWPAPVVTGGMTGGAAGVAAANISGTLNNPTNTTQTATYTVTPTAGSCVGGPFTITVTVNPLPTVNAGVSLSAICQGGTTFALGGSFGGGATSAIWSDGGAGGTFMGNGGTTPGIASYLASEGAPSSVTLTLTTAGGSCGTVFSTKNLTINPNPKVNVGDSTAAICQGGTTNTLGGSIGGGATGGTWSTTAGGTFSPNANDLNATWTPPVGYSGTATLTLTTSGGSCQAFSSSKTQTVTTNNTISLSSAIGTNAQSVCIGTAITPITYTTNGATGATFTNLPTGVNGFWSGNVVTISGTPTVAGAALTYTVTLTGGCGVVTTTGTITVIPANTITLTSAESTTSQTACIGTAITPISYATTGAIGATVTNLATGVTGVWAGNIVTISGTPTVAGGALSYTVTLTGGCGNITTTGTIAVTENNTISLSSGVGTNAQTVCVNSAITPITYATTGATGIGAAVGLPAGVAAAWAANVITISGNPTAAGVFNYTIPLTGGCGAVNATGTITVTVANTAGAPSTTPTLCINTVLTNIIHATTGATGIGAAVGLPAGVAAAWAANVITISGTPTAAGVFNYTIPLTGGCGTVNATGTITVTANMTAGAASATPTLCIGTALTPITHVTTLATGIGAAVGLPAGVTAAWAANMIIISGTPTGSGVFAYTIPLTGGCGAVTTTGTITVTSNNTVTLTSGAGSDAQTKCINTAITNITYATTGATGATVTGLPAGVTGLWAANVVTISGTPTAAGPFTYTVTLTGGCGVITTTGTITVTTNNTVNRTSPVGTNAQTVCINSAITNITYATTGATGATVTGLPAGVTGSWLANVVTISGTPTASGPFTYTVTLTGGCGVITTTGTITVTANNTVNRTSPVGTNAQTVCINSAITNITYATTGATGATVTGLPAGVTGSWLANVVTISGTPTASGPFTYTVTLTGGCGVITTTGTITVTANNTVNRTSPVGTDAQTVCINTAITNITYATTGATGATVTGLPAGVTGTWLANVVTISGTPTAAGPFTYTVTLTGGCVAITTTGSITVTANNTVSLTSAAGTNAQTKCINTAITNITYATTGVTGATVTGLPAGVTGTWLSNVVIISGTPTAAGPFTYTVTLTGGCGVMTTTGTITVTANNTVSLTSAAGTNAQTKCINTAITNITYATTGATGATVTGLPAGVTGTWLSNVVTISGTPTAAGPFTYTVTLTGGCGVMTTTGTITVTANNTVSLTSAAGTNAQTKCINTAITNITYATTGATGATVTGLPAGVTGTWLSNVVTISGTPTAAGPFTYTVTLTSGCGVITTTGTITVTPNNTVTRTSPVGTDAQTVCINTAITSITYATTGATGATVTGLPIGVTGTWLANVVTIGGTPTAAGPFTYTVTLTGGCGVVTAIGTISVTPQPTATASSNGPLIPGSPLSLTGGPGGMTTYAWTGPNGFISALQSPVVSASATTDMAGVYTLTVTNSSGCQSSATTIVASNPLIVTNVNDNGIGSLRYAMNYANSTVGTDIITFSIPGYGPFTIQPHTALPTITDPVIIDGYSQPGASATSPILLIEIDGTNAGAGSNGLTISGGSCTVKGLVINRFAGDGIQITNSGGNIILGNYIGVDVMGESPEGNSGDGIKITNGSSNNKIGGVNFGEGNLISANNGAGISVLSSGATGNLITSNSIYSNGKLGINLVGGVENANGVTTNDTGDGDSGPNNLQNYPVLASVISSTGSVTISGSLNSGTSKVYNLQFFASKLADGSGYGEGQNYLGSNTVTTDASGNAAFNATFSITSSAGTVITATATDPLGNTSEFSKSLGGLQDQKVAAGNWPFIYTLNADGVPNITDGSDLNAVRASFATWAAISTATIRFTEASKTTSNKYANANDGVNLVSFEDDQFPFSYGVLAVAAKTLKVDPTTQVAQIIDADIVVNPEFVNDIKYNLGILDNAKNKGYFDIQSVITHEIGHVLGLLHSGVVGATMFYTLGSGTKVRTLEQDDISWASYGYPGATYNTTYGSISGNITYGYGGQPVAGALVYAINTVTKDSVHAYSDASGNYLVPGLIPASYYIYIEPLDGNVNGYNLRPGNISPYIYANTVYTDYPGEFYSGSSESNNEATDNQTLVSVSVGKTTTGINLITNQDHTPPYVVKARATDVSGKLINILSNFSIRFSEPVDETSLSGTSCYLTTGTKTIGGNYTILGDSVNVIMFDPESVLEYSTGYTLHITGGVKDVRGNALQPEFTTSFTTVPADIVPPKINEVIPENGATRVFVTAKIRVFFSEPMNKPSVENGFALNSVGLPIAGSFSWDNDNTSVTYTPSGSLKEGSGYTVTLPTSITDLSGNQLANSKSYSFTTVAKAAPTATIGPANGSTGVPVTTPIVVDFSEPINIYTVNSTTFKLLLGNTQVTGTYEFINDNSRVIFRPGADLAFSQTYTIKLTNGIMDVSQTIMKFAGSTTTFTTAANAAVPDILYLDPSSGVAGTVVTIAGSGFDPNPAKNTIIFNTASAPVKTATLTTLTTEVPLAATSGPVQVTVNGTASDNTMYFYLIPQSLDPCSNIIANTSTGTKSTHGTDVTPDGAVAYVTNPNEGTVTAVGLNSLQTTSITVGSAPTNININSLGTRAYVTNFNSHTVSVIDLVSTSSTYNKAIETIPVGIEPYGIVSTPDGKRVYVANYYSETMSVIDVDPNSGGFDHVVANVSTGTKVGNTTITPDGAMVLVTGDDGLKIIDSNPKDKDYNGIIANVSSGTKTNGVAVIPDAGLAIVTTEEGHVLVVNLHPDNGDYSEAVIANVSTGTKVSDVKASGDALFVYLTDTGNDQLLVYQIGIGGSGNTNGSAVSGLTLIPHNKIPVGNAPQGMVISAKSDKLYVIDTKASTGNREITTVAICCGPITPAKTIGDLIISIQNMINNGNITKLRGYALIVTLNSALRNINANRPNLAIVDLTAFNILVNTYIKNKQITSAQGIALVNSATALINQLKGTKSALAEPSLTDTVQVNQGLIPVSRLGVIYPNPFKQSVTINYEIAENKENPTKVQIMIYDINGRLVGSLVDEVMQSGCYTASWNGTYDDGTPAPYGTYFVLFRAGNVEDVSKIMLLKPR